MPTRCAPNSSDLVFVIFIRAAYKAAHNDSISSNIKYHVSKKPQKIISLASPQKRLPINKNIRKTNQNILRVLILNSNLK
jgi:hypothetical protein